MQIVRRKSDNRVQYLFTDGDDVVITDNALTSPLVALDITTATHEVVVGVPAPAFWVGGAFLWDGGAWAVVDVSAVAAAQAAHIASIQTRIDVMAKAKRDSVVAAISAAEMASWSIKRGEAMAYQAAGAAATDADAPNLVIEATARGITTAALVAKVLVKTAVLSTLEAQIAGTCGKHQDAIAALSIDLVATYDITTGWPV